MAALVSAGTPGLCESIDETDGRIEFGRVTFGLSFGGGDSVVESRFTGNISCVDVELLLPPDFVSVKMLMRIATTQNNPSPPNQPKVNGAFGAGLLPPPPPPSSVGMSISSCVSMRAQIAS